MAYVNVAEWKPEQVIEWLKGLDNAVLTHVHTFLNNEVNGQQLLNLRPDDLQHLGVQKLGHQELILEAVEHLRNFHYELDRENLQLLALRLSCRARSLYKELLHHTDSKHASTQTLADVANIITAVKPIACWLGRSPFAGNYDYHHRKMSLLKLSLEIATCAQRDRFAERPVEEIRKLCDQLACLADNIICDIQDPLLLQPASLDLATVKKRAGDDLGFFIQPSFHGVHQISEIKFSSPAHQCGKIEEGDEVVQVNYQTVVGWQTKKVMFLLEESPTDVFLTLKKRPRHTKVYGQIYIKPYRLPSKKRAAPYIRWHENLPSPRPELLTIPDFEIPLPRSLPQQNSLQPVIAPLSDSEPLVSSSSSDEDNDDGAFLPDGIELGQASPTSMRLYVPKQRTSVQRRATVTGASPTNRRPPINIEQFWRELQLEHQWRGAGHNTSTINTEFCHLREKSLGMSNSLASVSVALRPTTCLGIERSMKTSLSLEDTVDNRENTNVTAGTTNENLKQTSKKVILNKDVKIDKEPVSQRMPMHVRTRRSPCSEDSEIKPEGKKRKENVMKSNEVGESFYPLQNNMNSEMICIPSYEKSTNENTEEIFQSSQMESEKLTSYVASHFEEKDTKFNAIDESALKIPVGNVKYIDDASATDIFVQKDVIDEPIRYIGKEVVPAEQKQSSKIELSSFNHSNPQILLSYCDGSHFTETLLHDSENISGTPGVNCESICKVAESSSSTSSSSLINQQSNHNSGQKYDYDQQQTDMIERNVNFELCIKSASTVPSSKKVNILELPPRTPLYKTKVGNSLERPQMPVQNVSCSSYKSKFAQSFASKGSNKLTVAPMSSPKNIKKRNILLAKRRNVNIKDLGHADCEGWLLHRCRWNGSGASLGTTWIRAWFVLKGTLFYGFKSPYAAKANIMISLPGFTASVAEEVKSKQFAFKVYHTGTVFYFAAESELLLTTWLDTITLGTITTESGKPLESDDIFFSETDEESEHDPDSDSGTCLPSSKTYKLSGFLGGNNSPNTSRSQQNLASEVKISQEVQKKFGSLKKLGRKVTDMNNGPNTPHNDGSGMSSSLDRKYLCFLSGSRNSTVPVPTAQFRSYRRVPNSSQTKNVSCVPGEKSHETTHKNINMPQHAVHSAGKIINKKASNNQKPSGKTLSPKSSTEEKKTEHLLKPLKMTDLREQNIHASNPSLQASGDISDYRLAAERLREFNMKRKGQREDTSGFVTLEEFMLSRQEEERKSDMKYKVHDDKLNPQLAVSSQRDPVISRQSSFNSKHAYNMSETSNSSAHNVQRAELPDNLSRADTCNDIPPDSPAIPSHLKNVAQYQPPPLTQLEEGHSLTLAFEMHLGEKDTSNSKISKFRSIFTSSKSNHRSHQKQSHLELPCACTADSRQKTLLGSPRLHRAIFRDKHCTGTKSSSSESNCSTSSSSPLSPPVMLSPTDWMVESVSDTCISPTKPTMGISMLGKRPSRRVHQPSVQNTPVDTPPDYPGLEYPPVFEPETYTLSDASSLMRSRTNRVQSDKSKNTE